MICFHPCSHPPDLLPHISLLQDLEILCDYISADLALMVPKMTEEPESSILALQMRRSIAGEGKVLRPVACRLILPQPSALSPSLGQQDCLPLGPRKQLRG